MAKEYKFILPLLSKFLKFLRIKHLENHSNVNVKSVIALNLFTCRSVEQIYTRRPVRKESPNTTVHTSMQHTHASYVQRAYYICTDLCAYKYIQNIDVLYIYIYIFVLYVQNACVNIHMHTVSM